MNEFITTYNNIRLVLQPLPINVVIDYTNEVEETKPEVPKVPFGGDEASGRWEDNPDDPAYIKALKDWDLQAMTSLVQKAIVLGVEVDESTLPEKFPRQDDDRWIDLHLYAKTTLPDNIKKDKIARYVSWVELEILRDIEDYKRFTKEVLKLMGLLEEDVKKKSKPIE